jgi:sugar lactone lactonase YvrE
VYGQKSFDANLTLNGTNRNANTLSEPTEIAIDPHGGIYICDFGNFRIMHYSGTNTTPDRVLGQNGSFTVAVTAPDPFLQPSAIAVDASGDLYEVDRGVDRVVQHFKDGMGKPDRVYGQVFNAPQTQSVVNPRDVAIDPNGGIYVANDGFVVHFSGTSTKSDRSFGPMVGPIDAATGNSNFGILATIAIAADANNVYVADGFSRVAHLSGTSGTPDRFYGKPQDLTNMTSPSGLAVDPAGGVYVAETTKNRVVHYSGASTTPDRVYGAGSTPSPGAAIPSQPAPIAVPTPVPAPAPVAAAPASGTPDWSNILFNEHDGRISAGACEKPDPRGLGRTICVNYKYAALDQVTYADMLGDGGLEAVIPLDSGGPLGADSSIVYRLDGPRPRLVIPDGPGGIVNVDASSGLLFSAAPDPSSGCASLDCSKGLVRTIYKLVGDLLVLQGTCTYMPDPNNPRVGQGDCGPVAAPTADAPPQPSDTAATPTNDTVAPPTPGADASGAPDVLTDGVRADILAAIDRANTAWAQAGSTLDASVLDGNLADSELADDLAELANLQRLGQMKKSVNQGFSVTSVTLDGPGAATVKTHETWAADIYSLGGQLLQRTPPATYDETYSVAFQDGGWIVTRNEV